MSEVVLLVGVIIGLACVGGFFWLLGKRDNGFAERKQQVLFDQLTRITDTRSGKTGLELYASYSKEAQTTGRLLTSGLEKEEWLRVSDQHASSLLALVSMGAIDQMPTLVRLNERLKGDADPRAREIGDRSQWLLDFERQYALCRHREIVGEIVKSADAEANGEPGNKLAERIRASQATDWRITRNLSELKDLLDDLPRDNSLKSTFDRFLGQLIEIETTFEGEKHVPKFAEWVEETGKLIERYPDNAKIADSIVKIYDRLSELRCYPEAEQLLTTAMVKYGSNVAPEVQASLVQLTDRQSAAEIQLDRWTSLIRTNPDDSPELVSPMIEGARKLQADKKVTRGIVERYIDVLDALEDSQQYESLSKARTELLPIFTSHDHAGQHFASYCAANSKRAALVGKPFVLPTNLAVGGDLDPSLFKDKMTAVVFWTADQQRSFEMLGQLDQLFTEHKGAGFHLLAINVDPDPSPIRAALTSLPEWSLIIASGPDATGANPLAVEYGIHSTPYLVLVDTEGVVMAVSLTVREMWDLATEKMPSLSVNERQRRSGPAVMGR